MKVVIYHHIQPDYLKRMKLITRHVLYWYHHGIEPMSLVPISE